MTNESLSYSAMLACAAVLLSAACGTDGAPSAGLGAAKTSSSNDGKSADALAEQSLASDAGAAGQSANPQSSGATDPQPGTGAGNDSSADAAAGDVLPAPPKDDAGSTGTTNAADAAASGDAATTSDVAGGCNTTEPTVLYLSADDSNSMAGATLARGLIHQGQFVYKAVRTYEFLNYYDFPYPAAPADHVAASAQMLAAADGDYHLQIGVRAQEFSTATRRRLNVALAVDTSASMGWGKVGQTGLDIARTACSSLVATLAKGDTFTLIGWGDTAVVLVDGQTLTGPDAGALTSQCNKLQTTGTTGLSSGLATAYAAVKKNYDTDKINRVILISDGGANLGQTDAKVIADAAKDADNKAILLMGAGVGDPWNYNDVLMNAVTDPGKGAYVFMDSQAEAQQIFGTNLLRHVEIAARNVQVQVTLPPTFQMKKFYGEQYSTDPKAVEPQHLAANDAMVFNQVIHACDPKALTGDEVIKVVASWEHPVTHAKMQDSWSGKMSQLLASDHKMLTKGDAIVAYAEALKETQALTGAAAVARVDAALAAVATATAELGADADLLEITGLLQAYRKVFENGAASLWQTGGTGAAPIPQANAGCAATGVSLNNLACALDIADKGTLLAQTYTSPTKSNIDGTYAATAHYGAASNALAPKIGSSYVVMATGPALGTAHSTDIGGQSMVDPVMKGGAGTHNAVEWRLELKAPLGANGIRLRHVFFSEEYDDYVGSSFNDKFYIRIEAGSTNGGVPTVINYTDCRNPDQHYDFVCSPGMQFCNPRARYCYIAVNTALSECCWLGGCPAGKAKTDISGTGFSCAADKGSDGQQTGSSTGWLMTEWPIEPGEIFYLTFHLHDTGDGVFDSAAILDGLQFVGSVTPGTWPIPQIY